MRAIFFLSFTPEVGVTAGSPGIHQVASSLMRASAPSTSPFVKQPKNSAASLLLSDVELREMEFTQRMLPQFVLLDLAARRHADRLEVGDDAQVARDAEIGDFFLHELEEI